MAETQKKPERINAVDRALKVMECLGRAKQPMGVNEIASKLGEHQSTTHRVLSTLKDRGYVYQDESSQKYGLSYKVYVLGKSVEKNSTLIQIAKPYAKSISQEFQETVNVATRDNSIFDGYWAMTVFQEKYGNRGLSTTESVGKPYECASSAVGKVLLAFSKDCNEGVLRRMNLKKYTENTIVDNDAFIEEMQRIRAQGYAVDNEENERGLFCVAAPILNADGDAIMAFSVSGYKGHILELGIERIVKALKESCLEISRLVM